MSQMLKSSGAMAVATMSSRVFGMVREMIYFRFMGASVVTSAFQLAFMIPNLFRRLLGEGALTASFIPIFKEKERTSSEAEMWHAANAVISGLLVVASIITVVAIIGISIALKVEVFSFKTELMLRLLRIMFPYMLLVTLTAIFMGMLNARGHFFIPASGALVMNLVMIGSVYFLAPHMGLELDEQIFGLAIGVIIAGVAQALFQLPTLWQDGFRYQWVTPWGNETVRRVVRQMIPGTIGIAAFQINVLTTQLVAFWVGDSIVAYFNLAVRLMELPQGVFGISLATYLLPTLSGLAAEKKYDEYRSTLNQAIDHLMFINLLATVLLVTLAEPIIRLLFEHGKFVASDTPQAALRPGVSRAGSIVVFAGEYPWPRFLCIGRHQDADEDQHLLPVHESCARPHIHLVDETGGGMGLANTLSSSLNADALLFYALRRKLGKLEFGALRHMLWPIVVAGIIAGLMAFVTSNRWDALIGHRGTPSRAESARSSCR